MAICCRTGPFMGRESRGPPDRLCAAGGVGHVVAGTVGVGRLSRDRAVRSVTAGLWRHERDMIASPPALSILEGLRRHERDMIASPPALSILEGLRRYERDMIASPPALCSR